jgi:hypothetical protein
MSGGTYVCVDAASSVLKRFARSAASCADVKRPPVGLFDRERRNDRRKELRIDVRTEVRLLDVAPMRMRLGLSTLSSLNWFTMASNFA